MEAAAMFMEEALMDQVELTEHKLIDLKVKSDH